MNSPLKASVRLLAVFATVSLAALPLWRASAQTATAKTTSSPNGKIVFQSTQGGDGSTSDIYVMDADGKHQTRLTDNTTADDARPIWSPAGDQIAFISDRGGNGYEIYLMNADGTNQRPLRTAANGGPLMGQSVEWSPDGTRLAYVSGGNVYVVQVGGGAGLESVTAPLNVSAGKADGSQDVQVSWSPAGDRLLIRNDTLCGGCTNLYTENPDGSGRTQLTSEQGFEVDARWSPAGARVAYEADRGTRGIYVRNADGTGDEMKISGAVVSLGGPKWSPDGTRIAFKSNLGNLYVVNADGSGLTLLTDVLANGGSDIFWSPDGAKVAFHSSNGISVDLYVVNADGSRKATNYTKTKRDDEFASTWQSVQTQ